jgi:pimeloyl-ACP methyl ester carboxylesterase
MMTATEKPVLKFIELPDRVKLQYVEQGNRAGTPVIFLHGITDSWHSFERVLPNLPESIHAFALSQRGHGDSDRPADGYRPSDFAADVAAFMDALHIERAVIAGHSMGSHIAQRFAIDYPERTLGLVLMGTFFNFRDNAGLAELWDAVSGLRDPVDPGFALDFQQSTLATTVPQMFLETVVEESLKVPARVWRAALEGLVENGHSELLSRIEAPTLIVWGKQDLFCPRSDQEALQAAITGSELMTYPRAGHGLHWDEPERFAADIAAFTESLSE